MKLYLILLYVILVLQPLAAQKKPCVNSFDSTAVIEYIKGKGWIDLVPAKTLVKLNYIPEVVSFANINSETCRWKVISQTSYHSNEGDCHFTNGCTVVVKQTIVLSARNKRLISRRKSIKFYPNYE